MKHLFILLFILLSTSLFAQQRIVVVKTEPITFLQGKSIINPEPLMVLDTIQETKDYIFVKYGVTDTSTLILNKFFEVVYKGDTLYINLIWSDQFEKIFPETPVINQGGVLDAPTPIEKKGE
jgi:hypothetical protein